MKNSFSVALTEDNEQVKRLGICYSVNIKLTGRVKNHPGSGHLEEQISE